MTDRFKIALIAAAVLLLVGGYFYIMVDWDARAIRQRVSDLAHLVEKDGPVSTLEAVGRSRQLVRVFAEGAEVEYAPGRRLPKDLDAMGAAFISAWGQVDKASVRITRHEVEVDPDGSSAESMLTARCSVILNGSEQMGDTLEYRIYWSQRDGDWFIRSLFPL